MLPLWDVLLAHGVDPALDGWSILSEAHSVSLDGLTVAGYGPRNGNTEAFIATIPEPASIALLTFAALILRRRR